MGKRKSRAAAPKKTAPKLEKEFDCPFCCRSKCVAVRISRPKRHAELRCRVCDVEYSTTVTGLDQPVDVYGAWIDACVHANLGESVVAKLEQPSRKERVVAESESSDVPRANAMGRSGNGSPAMARHGEADVNRSDVKRVKTGDGSQRLSAEQGQSRTSSKPPQVGAENGLGSKPNNSQGVERTPPSTSCHVSRKEHAIAVGDNSEARTRAEAESPQDSEDEGGGAVGGTASSDCAGNRVRAVPESVREDSRDSTQDEETDASSTDRED